MIPDNISGNGTDADEGENAHSAFFVLEQQTFLVLTWDPDRGREVGGAVRLELAADEIESEVERLETHGIAGMVTRFIQAWSGQSANGFLPHSPAPASAPWPRVAAAGGAGCRRWCSMLRSTAGR